MSVTIPPHGLESILIWGRRMLGNPLAIIQPDCDEKITLFHFAAVFFETKARELPPHIPAVSGTTGAVVMQVDFYP